MTCEEFQVLTTSKKLKDCTRAEIDAAIVHARQCETCAADVNKEADKELGQLHEMLIEQGAPEEAIEMISKQSIKEVAESLGIASDPECDSEAGGKSFKQPRFLP